MLAQIVFALSVSFVFVVITSYTKPFLDDEIGSMQVTVISVSLIKRQLFC